MTRRTVPMLCVAGALLLNLGLGTSCRDEPTVGERIERAADEAGDEIDEAAEEVRDEIDDHTDDR